MGLINNNWKGPKKCYVMSMYDTECYVLVFTLKIRESDFYSHVIASSFSSGYAMLSSGFVRYLASETDKKKNYLLYHAGSLCILQPNWLC